MSEVTAMTPMQAIHVSIGMASRRVLVESTFLLSHQVTMGKATPSQESVMIISIQHAIGKTERDNVNVHRAAANSIVFKSRAARGSVCNVLLCRVSTHSVKV